VLVDFLCIEGEYEMSGCDAIFGAVTCSTTSIVERDVVCPVETLGFIARAFDLTGRSLVDLRDRRALASRFRLGANHLVIGSECCFGEVTDLTGSIFQSDIHKKG